MSGMRSMTAMSVVRSVGRRSIGFVGRAVVDIVAKLAVGVGSVAGHGDHYTPMGYI
jgi:hypothetical protein